jgi:ATP-binding cassette subfamily F protein 3
MIVWQRPNLLLLDEPTNHLDLATREALSMALNEFEGTVMLVSHDRALLRAVCDEFWLVGRGAIGPFDGDLDDYQRYLLDESRRLREVAKEEAREETRENAPAEQVAAPAVATPPPATKVAPKVASGENRKASAQNRQQLAEKTRPLRKELEQIDQRMGALNAEKANLEQRLATPLAPADIAEAGRRLKAASDEIATLEERWLELSGELEALQA